MAEAPIVVKVSGHELDDAAFVARLGTTLAQFTLPVVLVHGGGKELSAAFERYGVVPRFVDGLRVTEPATMPVVEMVLSGTVNKRLVATLLQCDVRAIGLSGVDLGILRAQPYRPNGRDLGRVGEVISVDHTVLMALLTQGWTPVLSPVSLGEDGQPYNVNADMVAQAVAQALGASELVFVSNVKGVLRHGAVVAQLTAAEIEAAIADGTISGGMVPKVRAALDALEAGVGRVRICDLDGVLRGGTQIVHA